MSDSNTLVLPVLGAALAFTAFLVHAALLDLDRAGDPRVVVPRVQAPAAAPLPVQVSRNEP